ISLIQVSPVAGALAESTEICQPRSAGFVAGGGAGGTSGGGGMVSGLVDPRWQVKQVTLTSLKSVTPKSWLLMRWTIASILRAMSLAGLASEAKSKVDSGWPSVPTWQWVQRTPSDWAKNFMLPSNCSRVLSFDSTCKFL